MSYHADEHRDLRPAPHRQSSMRGNVCTGGRTLDGAGMLNYTEIRPGIPQPRRAEHFGRLITLAVAEMPTCIPLDVALAVADAAKAHPRRCFNRIKIPTFCGPPSQQQLQELQGTEQLLMVYQHCTYGYWGGIRSGQLTIAPDSEQTDNQSGLW